MAIKEEIKKQLSEAQMLLKALDDSAETHESSEEEKALLEEAMQHEEIEHLESHMQHAQLHAKDLHDFSEEALHDLSDLLGSLKTILTRGSK